MVAACGEGLARNASGDDRVQVMRTDHTCVSDGEFEPTDGFRGSGFSRNEIEQFINGHTGDSMAGMNRPTPAQVSQVLDQATPTPITGQNAEEFVATYLPITCAYSVPIIPAPWPCAAIWLIFELATLTATEYV